MSHIPNNAMPHAGSAEPQQEQGGLTERIADQAAEMVYNHPRKVAAGAALAAGAVAAAIPLVRGRSGSETKSDKKS